jgi:hypothetical protein
MNVTPVGKIYVKERRRFYVFNVYELPYGVGGIELPPKVISDISYYMSCHDAYNAGKVVTHSIIGERGNILCVTVLPPGWDRETVLDALDLACMSAIAEHERITDDELPF